MQATYSNKTDAFLCRQGKDGLCDFGARLHSGVEIVLLYGGETKVWIENREAVIAKEGDAIIIFPNQQYRFETQVKEKYVSIMADIRRLGEFLSVLSSYTPTHNVIKGAANDAEICELAKNIIKTYAEDKSDYRDTVLKGYVTAILGKILSITELRKNNIANSPKNDTLGEIVAYCNSHFCEKLSLEMLERELHISKYYISHVINEKLGEGFNEYLNSLRINEASRLLVESDKSIKEISSEVGFGTVRSFDRAFLRKKGETAREYRKRNAEILKKE